MSKKAAELSARLFKEYHGEREVWSGQISLDRDYYLNKQWTQDERSVLQKRSQAELVINRIFPVVQQKVAQLTSHKPVIRAMAVEQGDNKKAHLWSMMLDYVLQGSHYPLVDLEVKREHTVSGVGYYYAYIDTYADDGKGEVRVTALPPEIVYVDPNSKKVDYSDADHIIVSQVLTFQQAANLFPDKKRSLKNAAGQLLASKDYGSSIMVSGEGVLTHDDINFTSTTDKVEPVRIIERYTKTQVPFYYIIGEAEGVSDIVDQDTYQLLYAGNDSYDATKVYRTHVVKTVSAGDSTFLSSNTLPIAQYPIVPTPNVWTGTPYPLSDVRYLRGIQDEINKRRSLMILNATSMSSSKWLVQKGSVNPEEFEAKAHQPAAVLQYNDGYERPQAVFPAPLPGALVQLEVEAKADIEHTSGIFAVSHGDPNSAPETYGATLALEEFANRRLAPSIEVFNHAKQLLGEVIIGLCQEIYTIPKYIRVVGDEGLVEEVVVNQEGEGSDNTFLDQEKYDVIVQSGRFAPTNRIAHAQFMMTLFEKGAIDNEALLEALDLPNKDRLIERMALNNQLRQTIEAQGGQIKDLEGLLQTARRQLQQAGIKTVVDETRSLEKKEFLETRAKQKVLRESMDLDQAAARLELKTKVREHELDMREDAIAARTSEGAEQKDKE